MIEARSEFERRFRAAVARLREHARLAATARDRLRRERLAVARERLRTRLLEDFRRTEWPRLQMLDEIFRKGLGLPVPTLSVCGSGTAEVRFTKLLAYFFDAGNRHGLGGLLARAVFACDIDGGDALPFEGCRAYTEVSLGRATLSRGREMDNAIDILLEVGEQRILVEQKIRSAEGEEQLPRYSATLERQFGRAPVKCFFLTPEGRSGREERWQPLSYRELFSRLASVLDRHALSHTARHNLRALLWDLILGPLAQDSRWMDQLQEMTHHVAGDIRRYVDLKNWLSRYKLGREELRVLTKLVE